MDEQFIKNWILYDIYSWKSAEKSYKNLTRKIGENSMMEFSNFERIFNEISKENWDENVCKKNLNSYSTVITCILNDVISGTSKEYSFLKISNFAPKFPMIYFEYWRQKFENGNWDFQVEDSILPEAPEFTDFSTDVVKIILGNLDYENLILVRSVSRSLRTLVDLQKSPFGHLKIRVHPDHLAMKFDSNLEIFAPKNWNFKKFKYRYERVEKPRKLEIFEIENPNFQIAAFEKLAEQMANKNLKLETFDFSEEKSEEFEFGAKIGEFLKTLKQKIQVKHVKIRPESLSDVLSILPNLHPDTLETIEIDGKKTDHWWRKLENFGEISNLKQWKWARNLNLRMAHDFCGDLEEWERFEKLEIEETGLFKEKVHEWREIFAKSANFKSATIKFEYLAPQDFRPSLGTLVASTRNTSTRHYEIPDSEKILEFKFESKRIYVEKIDRV